MPEFLLTVHGTGSFCAGAGYKTHREGVHPITPKETAAILEWKEQHPSAEFIVVTSFEPQWSEPEPLTGKLTVEDVRYGTHRARPVEPEPGDNSEPDDEPVYVYPCEHCPEEFSSAPILRRHTMLNHTTLAADAEEDARAAINAAKEAKGLTRARTHRRARCRASRRTSR